METNKCEMCSINFRTKDELMAHNKSAHGGQKFECKACRAAFRSEKELMEHNKMHRM